MCVIVRVFVNISQHCDPLKFDINNMSNDSGEKQPRIQKVEGPNLYLMGERDFLKVEKNWRTLGEQYYVEARSYFAKVHATTLTISTSFIVLIGALMQFDETRNQPFFAKLLLISSFVCITLSAIMGVIVGIKTNSFLNKAAEHYKQNADILDQWMREKRIISGKELPELRNKAGEIRSEMNNTIDYIHFASLIIGVVLVVTYLILFLLGGTILQTIDKYLAI